MSDQLREALERATEALAPFAGCHGTDDEGPLREDWWPPMTERIKDWFEWSDFQRAITAVDQAREALAAAPEPSYEWRACGRRGDGSKWRGYPQGSGQRGRDSAMAVAARSLGGSILATWIERRAVVGAPGPWERVEVEDGEG